MEFTPRASWGAKFQWRKQRRNFARNTSVRGTCAELSAKEFNYENIYPSYGSGRHAWLEFVRRGACLDHDHHHSRKYHGSTTRCDAADHNYSHLGLLVATSRSQGARAEWLRALFYSAGVSISAFASSAWLTTGAIACNFSPSRKVRSFTPMALRPVSRMSFTGVRTI